MIFPHTKDAPQTFNAKIRKNKRVSIMHDNAVYWQYCMFLTNQCLEYYQKQSVCIWTRDSIYFLKSSSYAS